MKTDRASVHFESTFCLFSGVVIIIKYLSATTLPLLLTLSACITPPANDDLPVPGMSLVSFGPTDLSGTGNGGNAAYVGQFEGVVEAGIYG